MKIKPSKREVKSFRNKYLALTIISLLFFGISQAQYLKPNNSYGLTLNRLNPDSTLLIPTGGATPSLRGVDLQKMALYGDSANNLLYKYNPKTTTWDVVGGVSRPLTDGLVSGGIVTWSGQGLKFYVGPAVYILGGKYYYSNLDSVTLAAAPTSDSRIDLIGVDTSRHAFVDTGVVSATPIVPQAKLGVQIALTTGILLNAGDTIPNILVNVIYNENLGEPAEWSTHTENAPISADFNNTINPKKGLKDIFISRYNSQSIIYFATSTPYTLSSDAVVSGWIYLNKRFVNTLYAFLYNSTTGAKTNAIPLSLDNFDSTSYQQFVIPTSNFTWTGNTNNQFNTIEFYFSGYDTTDLKGLRMDWITLQKGIQSVPPQIDYSNKLDSVFLSNDSLFQYVKGVRTFRGLATGSSGTTKYILQGYGVKIDSSGQNYTINVDSTVLKDSIFAGKGITVDTLSGHTFLKVDSQYVRDTSLNLAGGTINQVLKKNSNANGDWSWQNESGGGGSSTGVDSTNTATSAGQTVFSFPYTLTDYTVQKIVTRNGVAINPADYTVNTGNITFTGFTCDSGDKIRFIGIK